MVARVAPGFRLGKEMTDVVRFKSPDPESLRHFSGFGITKSPKKIMYRDPVRYPGADHGIGCRG